VLWTDLLEDKCVSNNDANHWQHLLHQLHISKILPVDLSPNFNENDVSITEFYYENRNITNLLKVGRMCKKWLTRMSSYMVAVNQNAGLYCYRILHFMSTQYSHSKKFVISEKINLISTCFESLSSYSCKCQRWLIAEKWPLNIHGTVTTFYRWNRQIWCGILYTFCVPKIIKISLLFVPLNYNNNHLMALLDSLATER